MQAGCRQGREQRSHTSITESKTTFIPLTRILISSGANVTEVFLPTIGVSESRGSLNVLLSTVSHDKLAEYIGSDCKRAVDVRAYLERIHI